MNNKDNGNDKGNSKNKCNGNREIQGLSAAAATAPPSVEMTCICGVMIY